MKQQIIKCVNIQDDLQHFLTNNPYDKGFILMDSNSYTYCYPLLKETGIIQNFEPIVIPSGDGNKNLGILSNIWRYLSYNGATRKSLMINLGGGMLTDLGGFAAATFKRGIRFINIPTTLLGTVDAAVGGKTGINFEGLKNEIGVFSSAEAVFIYSGFFQSLDQENLLSGYAEMLKHSMLKDEKEWKKILSFSFENIDYNLLQDLLVASVSVKEKIVEEDPYEKGIRKALNLGHTIGHAFESFSYETKHPVLHGYAVAWGMVCELYLSYKFCGLDQQKLLKTVDFIKQNYNTFFFDCKQYDRLFEIMQHDKKNEGSDINFTLLEDFGKIKIDQIVGKPDIFESLDFYRERFGI